MCLGFVFAISFIQNVVFSYVVETFVDIICVCKDSLSTLDRHMDPGSKEKLDVR